MLARLAPLLLLAGCAVSGPPNGPPPVPADMHSALVAPVGSAALAAPASWTPKPTIVTPVYPVAAPQLLASMQEYLLAQPRTWLTVAYPDLLQAFLIVRSSVANDPDIVVIEAVARSPSTSRAVIFSQSRYDTPLPYTHHNRTRVLALVAALKARFGVVAAP